MKLVKLFDILIVSQYTVPGGDVYNQITIDRKSKRNGPDTWAIVKGGNNLNKELEWEYEPLPSSRDAEFYARCRYESAEEACEYLTSYLQKSKGVSFLK